jgi:tetratricopeptide (TPR) repeat protein
MAERHGGVDFFISYTGSDRPWAEWIAWQLEAAGHRVVVQAWDFRPGENFVVQMRRALDVAERTLAVVSAAYLESAYGSDEWTAAFIHDRPDTTGLVVVRVEDVSLPRLLRPWIYIDLVDVDAEAAAAALLAGLERGRRKPSQPPSFPPAIQAAGAPRFPGHGVANLPPRNPNFTGRQELLDTLARNLQVGSVAAVVGQPPSGQTSPAEAGVQALAGMGGVGKSQLALEYAHRHAADYQLRWWIPSEEPLAIPTALAALARRLGLGEQADQEETVAQVLAELGRRDRWLLIFDNAVHPQDLAGYQPSGGGGHVLVTTRTRAFGGVATRLEVGVFDRTEAAAFLQRRTGSSERPAAEALAEELGKLPLALEQAAAFMEQTGLGLGEYLGLYRQRREELLAKGEPVAYGATVDATFRLAIQRVAERSRAAVALMELCAFLASEAIPHDLLRAKPTVLPAVLRGVIHDEMAYAEAIGVLHGFSLLERDQAGMRVHRLVQAVMRHRLDRDARAEWAARAVELVWAGWPDQSWLPAAWPGCGQLLPHALAAAEHAEELPVARGWTASLLDRVGMYLFGRAELTTARAILERALAIFEAAYGPDHPDVATIVGSLGIVLGELGELPLARAQLERALAIREEFQGPDHPQVATTLSNLGNVLRELGELPEARAHNERALAIKETAYGPDHPEVATILDNLGTVLQRLGELPQARAHHERALAIFEAAYGPDHPQITPSLGNLGIALQQLGELREARAYQEQALAIEEAAYGPDHPKLAQTLGSLGQLLRKLGEFQGARSDFERALAMCEAVYGPDHPYVATTLDNLGEVLHRLGDLPEAQACEQRAQAIRQKVERSQ